MPKIERLSEEVEELAIEMAVNGERYESIAKSMGLGKAGRLKTYRKNYPDFEDRLQDGVLTYCEHLEEELLVIPYQHDKDIAKLLSSNIMKVLEYRHPKRYSPRQQLDFNMTIDISGALDRAEQRVIDVVPTNVVPLLGKK